MNNQNVTNDFFVAEGDEAKRISEQSNAPGAKVNYLKLKANESVRVMLLDANFPNYYCHGDFNLKIPSHVCTAPRAGMTCKSCDAKVKRTMKYLVPLYDMDKKEVVVFDTSKKHVAGIYSNIEAYGDDIVDEVFTLKRTGSTAQDTAYSFIALPPRQKASVDMPSDVNPFEQGSQERSDFYNNILKAPSDEYLAKILSGTSSVSEVTPVENNGESHGF